MTQYIDKDTVLEKINSLLDKGRYNEKYDCGYHDGNNNALYRLKNKLNTLEWKEVDFETAFAASIDHFDEKNNYGRWSESDLRDFAKHFFELGLQMKGK